MRQTLLVVANQAAVNTLRAMLPECRVAGPFDPLAGVYADRVLILRGWSASAHTPAQRQAHTMWLEQNVRNSCPEDTVLEWFGTLPELVSAALAPAAAVPAEVHA